MVDLHSIVLQLGTYRVSAKIHNLLAKRLQPKCQNSRKFSLVQTKAEIYQKSASVTYDNNLVQMRY